MPKTTLMKAEMNNRDKITALTEEMNTVLNSLNSEHVINNFSLRMSYKKKLKDLQLQIQQLMVIDDPGVLSRYNS